MAKKKINSNQKFTILAAGISVVLTMLVLLRTFELVQNLKLNFQGAPNSYALWPALALAIYAIATTKNTKVRYVSTVVIAVLATCVLVWFFGVTNAVYLLYK
jgi:hypothetical protein